MDPAEAAKVCRRVALSLAEDLEKETDAAARRSLALDLTTVASRMDPTEAAQICGKAARTLTAAFEKEKDANARRSLAYGLSSLSVRLHEDEAVKAVRLVTTAMQDGWVYESSPNWSFYELLTETMDPADASRVAQILVAAIGEETDANARWWLTAGLALVAPRMEPKQAARICGPASLELVNAFVRIKWSRYITGSYNEYLADGVKAASASLDQPHASQAAHVVVQALDRETENEKKDVMRPRQYLVQGLCSVASRMTPAEASQVLHQAAQAAIGSFKRAPSPEATGILYRTIAPLAEKMKAEDAAKVCAQAARVISDARMKDPNGLLPRPQVGMGDDVGDPLQALVSLAGPMEADEANRLCRQVIQILLKQSEPTNQKIIASLPQLDTVIAKDLARELALLLCSENAIDTSRLDLVLTDFNRSRPFPRDQGMMSDPRPPEKPYPCRLTTQELVDLLKMPTCFGRARRVVLDHLGNIQGRRFVNHWAFVRFARETGLDVDLTTPPRRPNREESIRRMLAILDRRS
jgi:hypothetical protein